MGEEFSLLQERSGPIQPQSEQLHWAVWIKGLAQEHLNKGETGAAFSLFPPSFILPVWGFNRWPSGHKHSSGQPLEILSRNKSQPYPLIRQLTKVTYSFLRFLPYHISLRGAWICCKCSTRLLVFPAAHNWSFTPPYSPKFLCLFRF